jgi:hypothetical protein
MKRRNFLKGIVGAAIGIPICIAAPAPAMTISSLRTKSDPILYPSEVWAKESLLFLRENLSMARLIRRDFDDDPART